MKQEINAYLENVRKEIIGQMSSRDLNASGGTSGSMRSEASDTGGQLYGASHIYYLIKGRKPGKMPPIEPIRKWIESRGLEISPWAIAKSIALKGTLIYQGRKQGLDIQEAVEKHKEEFIDSIAKSMASKIKSSILGGFKQAQAALQ